MKTATIQRAVLRRISRQGDMEIRIRTETLFRLIRACGLDWSSSDGDETTHREIDAVALEALCRLGGGKCFA